MTASGKTTLVLVCRGPECGERRGSAAIHAAFVAELRRAGIEAQVQIGWQSCFGRCRQGPNVLVHEVAAAAAGSRLSGLLPPPPGRGGALYNGVTPADVVTIVESHLKRGIIVKALILKPEASMPDTPPPGAPSRGEPE